MFTSGMMPIMLKELIWLFIQRLSPAIMWSEWLLKRFEYPGSPPFANACSSNEFRVKALRLRALMAKQQPLR